MKAINNPGGLSFNELSTILNQFGFSQIKTKAGSHFKWRNPKKHLTYMAPRQNPMKAIYIKRLIKLLNLHFNIQDDQS